MKKVRLLPLFLALSLLLSGCASTLEQTIPAETETKEKEIVEDQKNSLAIFNPSSDDELNIMMIGNSNCYYWTDELYGILTEAGYQNVSVCNVYYSGCTFEKHWNWLRGDEANYEFFIHNSRGKNAQKNVSLKTALAYQNWDAFFLVSGRIRESSSRIPSFGCELLARKIPLRGILLAADLGARSRKTLHQS